VAVGAVKDVENEVWDSDRESHRKQVENLRGVSPNHYARGNRSAAWDSVWRCRQKPRGSWSPTCLGSWLRPARFAITVTDGRSRAIALPENRSARPPIALPVRRMAWKSLGCARCHRGVPPRLGLRVVRQARSLSGIALRRGFATVVPIAACEYHLAAGISASAWRKELESLWGGRDPQQYHHRGITPAAKRAAAVRGFRYYPNPQRLPACAHESHARVVFATYPSRHRTSVALLVWKIWRAVPIEISSADRDKEPRRQHAQPACDARGRACAE